MSIIEYLLFLQLLQPSSAYEPPNKKQIIVGIFMYGVYQILTMLLNQFYASIEMFIFIFSFIYRCIFP